VISRRVVNASPLIFLTKVGLLEVLRQPGIPVLVPDTVLTEVGSLGPNDPAVQAVQQSQWMQVVATPKIPDVVLVWALVAGESTVLAVAMEQPGSMAILDDQAARRCARVLNIPTQGTLGLILVAKQQGLIPAVRPVVEQMRQEGMYMSDWLKNQTSSQQESPRDARARPLVPHRHRTRGLVRPVLKRALRVRSS
jgi:predicted nucleic acid-binding protein